jgi:prolipoprotein diacylglyceryltransferase
MWDAVRHPVQLYETAALLGILGVLQWRRTHTSFAGHPFVLFVALYAGSRLFLEAFRADAPLMPNGVRTVQVIALAILLGAVAYLYRLRFLAAEDTSSTEVEIEA